jgi:hypothetical protein
MIELLNGGYVRYSSGIAMVLGVILLEIYYLEDVAV